MGIFDHYRRSDAARDRVAIAIDVASGVLEECPVCRTVSDKQRDDRLPAAELEVHQRFDRADPSVAVFNGDRDDCLRRLRSVRDRFNYHCLCHDMG
ncbi:MAG: hypothetical protein QNJ91_01055 [Gammaproteobacteria bacterium]|nr:hypothetical protein [Gammaproteobacteria bacterium]